MIVWAIGGLDPTGGAGLWRDAWTARALSPKVELRCVATALTRQGRGRPAEVFAVAPGRMAACLERLPPPRAIKVGLVPAAVTDLVARAIEAWAVPVVVDPVMTASDGGDLGADVDALRHLAALASLVTPNAEETRILAGADPSLVSPASLRSRLHARALLLKSAPPRVAGSVRDVLVDDVGELAFERPRIDGPDPRGTGCALATAIACGLATGASLRTSVAEAIAWLDRARRRTRSGPDGRAHLG